MSSRSFSVWHYSPDLHVDDVCRSYNYSLYYSQKVKINDYDWLVIELETADEFLTCIYISDRFDASIEYQS